MSSQPAIISAVQAPAISLWRTRLWTAFHVTVGLVMLYLWVMGSSENRLYKSIVDKVVKPEMNGEQVALALLNSTHELLANRIYWHEQNDLGIRQRFFRGSDVELMVPTACGSFSHVLIKSLQVAGYKARFCQIKVGDTWGGHIMVEAEVEPHRWAVLGPLHGTFFKRPDGKLASFQDVQKDWAYYEPQAPPGFNRNVRFEDVRYTNWDKIPILMPALRWVLSLFMAEENLRALCIRSYMTNVYYSTAVILGIGYLLLMAGRFLLERGRRKRQWSAGQSMKYDVGQVGRLNPRMRPDLA